MSKVEPLLLVGVDAISLHLGFGRNRVNRMLRLGELPAVKVGNLWVTSRQALSEWVDRMLVDGKGKGQSLSTA
jgi:excisionase family DNA binding protein